MPGASMPAPPPRTGSTPSALRSSPAVTPPGRSRCILPSVIRTMVDSTPKAVRPPSAISSILSPMSSSTACAVVGLRRPEVLALGAASGRRSSSITSRAKSCGMRSATVSRPAVTSGWMPWPSRSGSTRVSGPGQ